MEVDIRNIYGPDNAMLTIAPLLIHMYQDHVYNTVSRQSRVLRELQGILLGTCHCKAVIHCVQVSLGVEGLENIEG
jgi:hypothetical protein